MSALDRAYGALLGLAIGDALGMPTQYTPRSRVQERYGVLTGFEPGPPDNPISRGMAAGRVTDDTDQAVILGELLVAVAAGAPLLVAAPVRNPPGGRTLAVRKAQGADHFRRRLRHDPGGFRQFERF